MEVPWRFVLYTFATAFATACLLACKGQASDTNEDSTTTQRKLQQQGSFSPFDTSSKPYGYGRGPNGRHLLAYGPAPAYTSSQNQRRLLEEVAPGRSLMQAYSPLAYAADSLGLPFTEGSARKRALLQLSEGALTQAAYVAQPASYGAYVPNMRQLREVVPAGAIGNATAVTYSRPVYGAHPSGPQSFGEYKARPVAYGGF